MVKGNSLHYRVYVCLNSSYVSMISTKFCAISGRECKNKICSSVSSMAKAR